MAIQQDLFSRQGRELLGLLTLLAMLVVLPTIGLFFLLTKAVENERFAVRQRLESIHREQLTAAEKGLTEYLTHPVYPKVTSKLSSRDFFVDWLTLTEAETLILLGEGNTALFPALPQIEETDINWTEGEKLEFREQNFTEAAAAYQELATLADDDAIRAKALQRTLRCLIKADSPVSEIENIYQQLEKLGSSHGRQGHLLFPNSQLLLLQNAKLFSPEWVDEITRLLVTQLQQNLAMPTEQRSFLQQRLSALGTEVSIPYLAEEQLASTWIQEGKIQVSSRPLLAQLEAGWSLSPPGSNVQLFYTDTSLAQHLEQVLNQQVQTSDIEIRLTPSTADFSETPFLEQSLKQPLSGWKMGLFLKGKNPFRDAARHSTLTYTWIAGLAVAFILLVAFFLLKRLLGHLRLTRLKNDFLSTVSHELKTPLTSSRLLIDTLLDGHLDDRELTERYLRSISQENERLTSLVENFLTFSRIQRGETPFQFLAIDASHPAERAQDAVTNRYLTKGLLLQTDFTKEHLEVTGDESALTTALINLLDNALKYSRDDSGPVTFRLDRREHFACYTVADHGIGISSADQKRVTAQFFQANQSLSRTTEGCGLGLGIVQLIVEAHGGHLEIDSTLGQGSTFHILIPLNEST